MVTNRPDSFDNESAGAEEMLLAEGLRRLNSGDSTGWRHFVHQHPEHATELEQRARRLQEHGFYTEMTVASRIGPYSIGRKMGQGGMGIVYRATREGETQEVALKIMRGDYLASPEARQRLRREVDAPKELTHPGIVRVLDADLESPTPWLAMELVEAPSLAQLIAQARQSGVAEAGKHFSANLGEQPTGPEAWWRGVLAAHVHALGALQQAHDRGLLHRDLKPSNLLVPPDGLAVLIDFGLARGEDTTTITRSGVTLGSLAYMAPELLQHRGRATPASDIYSLGVTLFHALALQLPFAGDGAEVMRAAILTGVWPRLSSLSPYLPAALDTVLACAMAPEPDRRYRSAAAFAADLQATLDRQPVHARPPGALLTARRWLRRHPTKSLAVTCSALFAVAVPTAIIWAKDAELRRVQIMSDLHLLGELTQHATRLWPERPDVVAAPEGMEAWLGRVDDVLSRRDSHREELVRTRRLGRQLPASERDGRSQETRSIVAQLEHIANNQRQALVQKPGSYEDWLAELEEHALPLRRRLEEVEGWEFADHENERRHRYLAELSLGLDRLEALRAQVLQRRQRARALHQRSIVDGAAAWREVSAELADRTRNPAYRGLDLEPQFGLLPLGKDPRSGLYEFAHLASGEPATRTPDGKLRIDEGTGIVLVLLPGGVTRIGGDVDAGGLQPDPLVASANSPSIEIALDPFFLAKFEMTQAQWVRQRGHNNCLYKPGHVPKPDCRTVTPQHPVDFVAFHESRRILMQLDLELPTNAQWEYAARGGTTTSLWTGGDAASLDGRENLLDVDGNKELMPVTTHFQPRDGWPFHAPVGSFQPNPFGFHDMLGNALEWCIDTPRPYSIPLRSGDGRGESLDHGGIRGGCFYVPASGYSVTARAGAYENANAGGVRAMRRVRAEGVTPAKQ